MRVVLLLLGWCWPGTGCSAETWVWDSADSMWVVAPGPDVVRDSARHTTSARDPLRQPTLCGADPLASLTSSLTADNLNARTVLHGHAPLVIQYDEFFSAAVAADIIRVASGSSVTEKAQFGRQGGVVWLPHHDTHDTDATVAQLVMRISQLVGIERERTESLQVAWYEHGQGYTYHYDAFDSNHGGEGARVAGEMQNGNRVVSALGYLSSHEDEDGGQTEFPRLQLSISPKVGRLVVFSNTDVDGCRYDASLHSSRTFFGTGSRRKWVFNLWFRTEAV